VCKTVLDRLRGLSGGTAPDKCGVPQFAGRSG
jgi:hypothetical protein